MTYIDSKIVGNTRGGTRLTHIDVLKGIGIILMVMGHMHYCSVFEKLVFGFHMPLFFWISGYLYSKPVDLLNFIKRKARTLLVPYAIIGFAYCVLDCFLSGRAALFNGLKGVFITTTYNMPVESALWFLPALFWVILIYALIDVYLKKTGRIIAIILITFIGCEWTVWFHCFPWGINSAMSALGFFAFGHWYYGRGNTWLGWINGRMTERWVKWVVGTVLIFFSTILILLNDNMNIRTGTFGVLPVSYICACVYIVFLFILCSHFQEIEGWKKVQWTSFLSYIGRNSVIYVCTNHAALRAAKKILVCCGLAEGQALEIMLEFLFAMILMTATAWIVRRTPARHLFAWKRA